MTKYYVQYWNEGAAEWRGTGRSYDSREEARAIQFDFVRNCNGCVRFRVFEVRNVPTSAG